MENQDKHDRFSIRKLSIGAASVLIGFAFVTGVGTHTTLADELNSGDQQPTAEVKSADDASQGVDTEVKNDNEQNGGQDVKTDQAKPEAAKGATPKVVAPVKTQQDQVAGTKIEQSTDKHEERQVSVAKDNQNGKQEEKTTTLATQSEVVNKQAIGSEEKADSNQVIKVQNLVSKKEFAVGLSQEEETVKGPKKIALAKANAASESVVDKLNSGKSLTDSELESEMNKFNDVLESGKKLTDLPADQQAEFDSLINYIKNDHTFRPVVLSAMHNATIYFATGFRSGIVSTTTISVPDGFVGFIAAHKLISDYHISLPIGYTFADPNQNLTIDSSAKINVAWCFIKPKEESATVHYVDDDDSSRSIPDGTTSGKYGTSVNYSSLVPSGYTLASPGSYTFTDAANQSFTIHLNEGTREARPGDGGISAGENNSTSTVNTNNNDSEEPTAPVTYQQLVLYIGKRGRIVKKGYITVSEDNDSLTEMFRLAKVKSKMPKGYKATSKIKKVAKHLDVWVTKKNQPSFNEAPRTKDVLYVAKNGKIVKRTRITGSVRKLAKSKLPKGYKISGIDRVNNHYDVWIKKEK